MFQLYICITADALYTCLHVMSIWFFLFMLLVSKTNKGLQIHKGNSPNGNGSGEPRQALLRKEMLVHRCAFCFHPQITIKQGNVSYNAKEEQTAGLRERREVEKMRRCTAKRSSMAGAMVHFLKYGIGFVGGLAAVNAWFCFTISYVCQTAAGLGG